MAPARFVSPPGWLVTAFVREALGGVTRTARGARERFTRRASERCQARAPVSRRQYLSAQVMMRITGASDQYARVYISPRRGRARCAWRGSVDRDAQTLGRDVGKILGIIPTARGNINICRCLYSAWTWKYEHDGRNSMASVCHSLSIALFKHWTVALKYELQCTRYKYKRYKQV